MSQWECKNSDSFGNETDWPTESKPSKTVRCVIDKEFSDGWRGLGSGDCGNAAQQEQAAPVLRREKTRIVSDAAVDSVRLKNHLEWKKQKENEYMRRREAERLKEEMKKEEKLREEKEKRRKEKEREEKMREWQEQKAREKEERRREEMVLKALEQEIKGVTQTIDKEKLIHEWIRLKNKQKQVEAEKKAELVKREKETRALRQALAEISYIQWKERTKNRRIALPKNGYQIFGPKPKPVVKEDWNHDFINGDDEKKITSARTLKSTISMTSIRGPSVSRTDLVNQFVMQDVRKKSPSSCQLNINLSKTSLNGFDGVPFKELKIPDMDLHHGWKNVENFISKHEDTYFKKLPQGTKSTQHDRPQPSKTIPNGFTSKTKLFNTDVLPPKNMLDTYLPPSESEAEGTRTPTEKATKQKKKVVSEDNLKSYLQGFSDVNAKLLINLNEILSSSNSKTTCSKNTLTTPARKNSQDGGKGPTQREEKSRRSRSYDTPGSKTVPDRSSSASVSDKSKKSSEVKKTKKGNAREKQEIRKKPKKPVKPAPVRNVDSPYCTRKTKINKLNRAKMDGSED